MSLACPCLRQPVLKTRPLTLRASTLEVETAVGVGEDVGVLVGREGSARLGRSPVEPVSVVSRSNSETGSRSILLTI